MKPVLSKPTKLAAQASALGPPQEAIECPFWGEAVGSPY
jgi:hypothetical protein